MAETTEQYRNRINQLKTEIETEPLIKEMRSDIAEGISKTGNRQADIEVRQDTLEADFVAVQQDASSASPSGAEVAVARGNYPTLDKRLTEKEQEVTAQFAQIAINVAANGAKGDGVTIDSQAIQKILNGGNKTVFFPNLGKTYLINETLVVEDNTTIVVDPQAVIKLANGSNCPMIKSKNQTGTIDNYNIKILGGIWDHNRSNQVRDDESNRGQGDPLTDWFGIAFQLCDIKGLIVNKIKLKDSVSWGVFLGNVTDFEVDDITFDYGTSPAINTDGVHVSKASFGTINNIKGKTGDDMIALNADDYGIYRLREGDIHDVTVSNIFGNLSYRGVRLLSNTSKIYNTTIEKIYGTYIYDIILFSRPNGQVGSSHFDNIVLDKLYMKPESNYAGIRISANVKRLTVKNFSRNQANNLLSGYSQNFVVSAGFKIDRLMIENLDMLDDTVGGFNNVSVYGEIGELTVSNSSQKAAVETTKKGRFIDVKSTGKIGTLTMIGVQSNADLFISNEGEIVKIILSAMDIRANDLLKNTGRISRITINGLVHDVVNFFNFSLSEADKSLLTTYVLAEITQVNSNAANLFTNSRGMIKANNVNGLVFDKANNTNSVLRFIGLDFVLNPSISEASRGDFIRSSLHNNQPVFYDGTKWLNMITGSAL